MTTEEIERVGSALTALFRAFEEVTIENVALKKVLKEAAHPNDPSAPSLPEQVLARIPEIRKQVDPKLEHLRAKILQALGEGRLPELADLAGSATNQVKLRTNSASDPFIARFRFWQASTRLSLERCQTNIQPGCRVFL